MKPRHTCRLAWTVVLAVPGSHLFAGYEPVEPREPKPDGIPITEPGTYAKAGATYVLTADIASPRSTIFLGKDVRLDLNGHTISYADGGYEHVPNWSFEAPVAVAVEGAEAAPSSHGDRYRRVRLSAERRAEIEVELSTS